MADEQSRYSRLAQITKLINTKLDLREVLRHVVTAISEEIVQCDSVGIYLPQEDGTYRGYVGKPETINGMTLDMHVVDPEQDRLAKEVIETGETVYIPDTSKDDRPDRRAIEAFKISSLLVAPLKYENHLYGLAFLFDYGIPMNLNESEVESIQAYINMAAVAIRNANNLSRKEILISEKQLLLNVTRELSLSSSIREALDICFQNVGEVLGNHNIAAHFLDPLAERQIKPSNLSANSVWTEEAWKKEHEQLKVNFRDDALFQDVLKKKESVLIPDVFEDPRPDSDVCRHFNIKGLYMLPLISMGDVLGTIAVADFDGSHSNYSKSAMQLAESIVDATAPVLSNLIYMERQELIIQERTFEVRKKKEELEEAFTDLKQVSKEKELILDSAGEGIFGMDLDGNITFSNLSAKRILGYQITEDVRGNSLYEVFNVTQEDEESSHPFIQDGMQFHKRLERTFAKKDGTTFPAEYMITPQQIDQQIVGYVITFKDITARKQMEEKIKYHAYYDSVTNIPNRTLFQDRLNQALAYAETQERSLAVLFLDLDRFKQINDTFGHSFGDSVLKLVADRLGAVLPKEATVSRQSGDEFVILLPSVEHLEEAIAYTEEIIKIFIAPFHIHNQEITIKSSIGISMYPDHGLNGEQLVKHADAAMYRAKERTGNQYQVYSDDIDTDSLMKIKLENELFKALEREEGFVLHYQPKVDMRTQEVMGMEALVRWEHPSYGLLPPREFIALAEETGAITKLGRWVLKEACRKRKEWYDLGFKAMVMSVNLSPQQLSQRNLVETVSGILEDTGLKPELLELELTENLIIHNTKQTVATIADLKRLGVQISIDDFGTGYSSLAYLKDLPVDTLKIDKSFIDDITNNSAITDTIISLAKNLHLHVIAEGVETKEQAQCLHKKGCHLIQGYYFSPPIPADAFLDRISTIISER
ncbi:sensor domain-containing phosphodiesterase [Halobacillus salinus]|uniref:EAL domain-containing protein n=1 Tax=Halobacillus salinus TaxID=192814 RepID=A0A4Z0GXX8_9BACI|nr:EAL domain-containing protein [Halobacillus salinus]TGB01990.1 EAL domain-containing protein [Halobacillus salinus]